MTLKKILYPLDLTGENSTNAISGELHTIGTDRYRCFAVNYGYFYEDSVVLVDRATNRRLVEGKDADYVCLYYNADISTVTKGKKRVCGAILVHNLAVSTDISVGYQLVGGHFANYSAMIEEAIALLELDNRNVYWKDVLDKPDLFEPAPHAHDIGDAYGFEYITDLLGALQNAILVGDVAAQQLVLDAVNKFYADLMAQLNKHLTDYNNPHRTTAHQVGAYTQEEIDRFLSNFTKKINDLAPVFAGINDAIIALTERVGAVEGGLSGMLQQVTTNTKDITRIFTQIGNIQSVNSDLGNRMAQAENDIDGLQNAMAANNLVDQQQAQLLGDHDDRLDALELFQTNTAKLDATQSSDISSLKTSLKTLSDNASDVVHWPSVTRDVAKTWTNLAGKIPYIGGDGVLEICQYVDYHVPGDTSDYSFRTQVQYNSSVGGNELYCSGYVNTQDTYIRSDLRDKTDVEELTGERAVEILEEIHAITYRLHGKGDVTAGLPAQAVQRVFPEAVTVAKNERGQERLSIRSGAINALLLAGWRYQNNQLKAFSQELSEMKQLMNEWKQKMED